MYWLLLRSVPQSEKQKSPQTLTGRVWFYYEPENGYTFVTQSSQIIFRDQAEMVVGVSAIKERYE